MGTQVFWALFIACCFYDSFKPVLHPQSVSVPTTEQEIHIPKPKAPGVVLIDPEAPASTQEKSGYLSVDLCTSCGFRNKMTELRKLHLGNEMTEELPKVTVVDGEYPIPVPWKLLGECFSHRFLSTFRYIFIAFLLFGDWIKEKTGMELPYYEKIKANKLQAGLGVYGICSLLSGYLLSSGAFEVSYNGQLIFSKLNLGRMPHPLEIVSIIRNLA